MDRSRTRKMITAAVGVLLAVMVGGEWTLAAPSWAAEASPPSPSEPPAAQAVAPPTPEYRARLDEAVSAFKEQQFESSRKIFAELAERHPEAGIPAYYLGLIAIQKKDLPEAIKHWKRYVAVDPHGAEESGVPARLTLMEVDQLQSEMKELLKREASLTKNPPEPNSIAVFPYLNRGDEKYQILAKGITALVISDLAKIPGIKVLEREKVQKLVDEIKLSGSGLVDKDNQARAGKILRAEKVMGGVFSVDEGGKKP